MLAHAVAAICQTTLRQLQATDDDREHVVEVMCDTAGQLADGFHLLRLAKFGFSVFAKGHFGAQLGSAFSDSEFQIGVAHFLEPPLSPRKDGCPSQQDCTDDEQQAERRYDHAQIVRPFKRCIGNHAASRQCVAFARNYRLEQAIDIAQALRFTGEIIF